MTDLSDILSCDQLDAMVKQQAQHVGRLGWKVAEAAANTKSAGRKVEKAVDEYNDFNDKAKQRISEAQTKLNNTPKDLGGKPIPKKNPDWQTAKDELDHVTRHRTETLEVLQREVDFQRECEQELLKKQHELEAELAKAREYLQQLKDAAGRCKNKTKRSGVGGSILVGIGFGLFVLSLGIFTSSGTKVDSHNAVQSQPAVTTTLPQGDVLAPPSVPAVTNGGSESGKPAKSVKKNVMDEPLGEDPQAPRSPEPPKPDKSSNDNSDDHSESVTTGDSHATGNDSSYEVSEGDGTSHENTGGNTAVGNDSGDGRPHEPPQRSDDQPQEQRPSGR